MAAGSIHDGAMDMVEDIGCGSFFDSMEDLLLDFPINIGDDIDSALPGKFDPFSSIWSTEDSAQLDWLPDFSDDSSSGGPSLTVDNSVGQYSSNSDKEEPFRTPSPVSVLESCGSAYRDKPPVPNGLKGKARSKRARPSTVKPVLPVTECQPEAVVDKVEPEKKKKKILKLKIVHGSGHQPGNVPSGQAVRKCLHCEITKTPQWRAGPLGPKTLCNACGVRYKSGRLFPEYRPAASPTFVPSVHSNSHRKVLEMRTKVGHM